MPSAPDDPTRVVVGNRSWSLHDAAGNGAKRVAVRQRRRIIESEEHTADLLQSDEDSRRTEAQLRDDSIQLAVHGRQLRREAEELRHQALEIRVAARHACNRAKAMRHRVEANVRSEEP